MRDPEKLKANKRRWYDRHRRVDPAIKRENYSRAAKLRLRVQWSPGGGLYEAAKRRSVARDLVLLGKAIEAIRRKIIKAAEFPQKNRDRALKHWRSKGSFKRRKCVLQSAYVRAVRRYIKRKHEDRLSLVKAMRRVDSRQNAILRKHLRRRYEKAIRRLSIPGSRSVVAQKLLGCSLSELRQHLEKQFQPGMQWSNYGFYGWHIDHIRPLSKFDLSDPAQQQEAFHFSNLQPLWAKENLEKRAK